MNTYIQQSIKGIYRFLMNPKERKLFALSLLHGNGRRYKQSEIKFFGLKFLVPDCQSFLWQFKEIFVEESYRFESISDTPLILDCGANIGTSCVYFKRLYPKARIVAFEAHPKIAEILKENLRTNNFSDIEVVDKAVWIDETGIEIGLETADGSSIYLEKNRSKVDSVRLKDFLDRKTEIDMLKMDIEGAEIEVLRDCKASLNKVRNLFVEFHSYRNKPQKLSELIEVLEFAGFKYFIKQPEERFRPFINTNNKFNPEMDLQLNIFAYRIN